MAPKTVTFGDTEVEIRETDDGFEAFEVENDLSAAEAFAARLRENPSVGRVRTVGEDSVRFAYDPSITDTFDAVNFPADAEIQTFEQNMGFDDDMDDGLYVKVHVSDDE